MSNDILFSVRLDTASAVKNWDDFCKFLIQGDKNIFSVIEKTVELFKNQEQNIIKITSATADLLNSQNNLTKATQNTNAVKKDEINNLKSQVIENQALNNVLKINQEGINKEIESYRNLQKERQNEINTLRLENKERALQAKGFSLRIKDNNKKLTPDNALDTAQSNANLKESIRGIEILNYTNNKKIKLIEDEINKTNQFLLTKRELLGIEKIQTDEIKVQNREVNNNIKSLELANKINQEALKVKLQQQAQINKENKEVDNYFKSLDKKEQKEKEFLAKQAKEQQNQAQKEREILDSKVKMYSLMFDQIAQNEKKAVDNYFKSLDKKEQLQKTNLEKQLQAEQTKKDKEKAVLDSKVKMYTQMFDQIEQQDKTTLKQRNLAQLVLLTNNLIEAEKKELEIKAQKEKTDNQQQKLTTKTTVSQSLTELEAETNRIIQNQQKVKNDLAKARQEELKSIDGQILNLRTSSKEIQSNINSQLVLKNSVKNNSSEAKTFKDNIDKNIESLKNQKKELTDNIRLLANKKDSLLNNNVSLINNTKSINENLNALAKQRDIINSLPKENKTTGENISVFDSLMERIKNYTIGTIISQTIRLVLQEIKAFFLEAKNEFLDLERSIQLVRGLILESNLSFETVNKSIDKTAEKTNTLYSSTAENVRAVISAGIGDLTEATNVYENSVALAKLGTNKFRTEQQNLNDVTNSAILIMNNLGIKSSALPTVFNQMAVAAAKSRLETVDYVKYLGSLTSEFSSIKAPLSDILALFAVFSNRLRSSAEANTALVSIMKKIQSPTAEMKNAEQELGIKFSPSEIERKGVLTYYRDLFTAFEKFANPMDKMKELFTLTNSVKGLQAISNAFRQVGKDGKNSFEEIKDSILNDTEYLKNAYALVIDSMSEKTKAFENSFINLFVSGFISAREEISTTFDGFVEYINIAIGVLKEFLGIFDTEGGNALSTFLLWFVNGLGVFLKGFILDVEIAIKIIRLLFLEVDLLVTAISNLIGGIFKFIVDVTTKGYSTAISNLKSFLHETGEMLGEKGNKIKEQLKDIFDTSKYNTFNPTQFVTSEPNNNVKSAEKKDFTAGTYFAGLGEKDNNTKLLETVQADIDKAILSSFAVARKETLKKYQDDLKKANTDYANVKDLAPKRLLGIDTELNEPNKTDEQKSLLLKEKEKINKALANNQENFNKVVVALEKRKNAEISKINEEERKKQEAEYKKRIDDLYREKIDTQKTKVNKVTIDADNLPKIETIKRTNEELSKEAGIYHQWAMAFSSGSKDRAERLKQESEILDQIAINKKNIERENLKDRLLKADETYNDRLNKVKKYALEVGLSEDQQLNNELAVNKTRAKDLRVSLETEKTLTLEQKKTLLGEIKKLNDKNLEDEIKIRDIRRKREHENISYSIDQYVEYYSTLEKLGQSSEEKLNFIRIEANNKRIAEIERLKKQTKNIDTIKQYDKEQNSLNSENIGLSSTIENNYYKNKDNESESFFNKEIKRINFLKDLNITSEKQALKSQVQAQEDYLKELNKRKDSFVEKYTNNPENEGKKKELDDIQTKIIETYRNIELDNKKITEIIINNDNEIFKSKLDNLMKITDSIKSFGDSLSKNNQSSGDFFKSAGDSASALIGVYKNLKDSMSAYNLLPQRDLEARSQFMEKFNAEGVVTSITAIITAFSKLVDVNISVFKETEKTSNIYKKFGENSLEAKQASESLTETFIKQLTIIPFLGDTLANLTRALTDVFGITKSEEQKKNEKEELKSQYELGLAKIKQAKLTTETKINIENYEFEEKKKQLALNFTTQKQFDLDLERLEIEHNTALVNIKEENVIKLLDIEKNYRIAKEGFQKDSYISQRNELYQDYLIEFQKLQQQGASQKEFDTIYQNYLNKVASLDLDQSRKNYDIQFELKKSFLNLQEDSVYKSLDLAKLDHDQKLSILEDEKTKGLLTTEQYLDKKQTIENDYLASKNQIIKNNLQKEYDILKEYQNKVDDLLNKREQDQQDKTKRAQQLQIDLAKKKSELKGSFFEQNQTNFETGFGGNTTEVKKTQDSFDNGDITYEEMRAKRQQLALEKILFYQNQLQNYTAPEDVAKINDKIQEGKKEYYEYIFDKEKEALDTEKANAKKKITLYEQQLIDQQKLNDSYLDILDIKYKNSAESYKNAFIDATKGWIEYAKNQELPKAGRSNNAIPNSGTTNTNPLNPYQPPTNSTNTNSNINPFNPYQPSNNTSSNTSTTSGNGTNIFNGIGTQTPVNVPSDYASREQMKVTLLDEVLNSKYGASKYNELFALPLEDLIKQMELLGLPLAANGGSFDGPQTGFPAILHGKEKVFNQRQTDNIFKYIVETTAQSPKMQPSIISYSISDITINTKASDAREIKTVLASELKNIVTKLNNR